MNTSTSPPATAAAAPAVLLFEDEQIRIDHVARGSPTLVITFDPLLVFDTKAPYGHEFLRKLGVDVIAVRKKSENFYQPLSRETFEAAVRPVLGGARRVLGYGSSLGAYAALYFCRDLDCEVIASSPRVSAHPVYGVAAWQRRSVFRHERFCATRPARCRATILYDPKEPMDHRFVASELLPQFPTARVIAVPYSGHPSNHFLSEIGFIAPFVKAVIAGRPPPQPHRRGKAASPSYQAALAVHCLQRRKPRWARDLAARSLERRPTDLNVVRTLGLAELALGHPDEAVVQLQRVLGGFPDDAAAQDALRRARELQAGRRPRDHRLGDQFARLLRALRRSGPR